MHYYASVFSVVTQRSSSFVDKEESCVTAWNFELSASVLVAWPMTYWGPTSFLLYCDINILIVFHVCVVGVFTSLVHMLANKHRDA